MLKERCDAIWQGVRDRCDGLFGDYAATMVQLATCISYDTRTIVHFVKFIIIITLLTSRGGNKGPIA